MDFNEARKVLEKQEKAKAVLEKYKQLEEAHERYGFTSRREFIRALEELEGGSGRRRGRGGKSRAGGRGLSEQMIAKIRRMKERGESNAEISRSTGVSPITVAKYVKGG